MPSNDYGAMLGMTAHGRPRGFNRSIHAEAMTQWRDRLDQQHIAAHNKQMGSKSDANRERARCAPRLGLSPLALALFVFPRSPAHQY
jgi:hypothetical protein